MPKVEEWLEQKIDDGTNNGCTMDNVVVRREWYICQCCEEVSTILIQLDRSDMSETQRQDYVAAVTCLMKLPPTSNLTRFPGALSRYDDFVAYHMTHASKCSSNFCLFLTPERKGISLIMTVPVQLHDNLHLFGAHKYFVWLFEKALRDECGYTGYQPVC